MGDDTRTYVVPDMSTGHCEAAITEEVRRLPGVESVAVDLETKLVRVDGRHFEDGAVIAAIHAVGYVAAATPARRPVGSLSSHLDSGHDDPRGSGSTGTTPDAEGL